MICIDRAPFQIKWHNRALLGSSSQRSAELIYILICSLACTSRTLVILFLNNSHPFAIHLNIMYLVPIQTLVIRGKGEFLEKCFGLQDILQL